MRPSLSWRKNLSLEGRSSSFFVGTLWISLLDAEMIMSYVGSGQDGMDSGAFGVDGVLSI